ncbi:hypothetical protein ACFVVM_04700 [Nocardia sp. NPDC058176]|uniref:hypothetical protein n=1 Tax=Nocardia sp. NPDC058176 TaxID=3346368 RepID=UPI0036DE3427
MTSQGERESGAEARTAAVLSIVAALACAAMLVWLLWIVVDFAHELNPDDDVGWAFVGAMIPGAPILIWLFGAVQLIRGRRVGRWIVAVFAGLGIAASTAIALTAGAEVMGMAVLAILVFGVILGLTVSGSTGRWLVQRSSSLEPRPR